MKKVLGLVISERSLGNSELLVKEIMRNIPDPCERELIRLTDFKIEPCKACYSCLKPGTPCRMDDDFNFILNQIKAADALVIGLPVYVYGPHGYLKMLSDRLLGAGHYGEFTRDKPCVLAVSYGAQGCAGYARTAALAFPRLLQMKIVDCWQVHAALPGESVRDQKNLEHARNLGANLFSAPEFAKGPRECACCGADLFRLLPDGKIECPICGAVGRLNQDGAPDFSENVHYRFSEEAVREHFLGWLVGMKEKFIKEKDQLKEVQKPYREMDWWIKPATLRQG
jgi:multimeric flavodoxin WrbA